MSKPITVYWSPSTPNQEIASYDLEDFNDPVPLAKYAFHERMKSPWFWQCPSIKDLTRNLYAVTSKFHEHTKLNQYELASIYQNKDDALTDIGLEQITISTDPALKMPLTAPRQASLENHVNVNYGRSWIFFASEPVEATFTAPWLPPITPAPKAMLAPGTLDIGQWFREFHLEYFAPVTTESWTYEKDEAFFFLDINTDRKIIFKRFDINASPELIEIANECVFSSSVNFTRPIGLPPRYKHFKQYKKRVLEILEDISY